MGKFKELDIEQQELVERYRYRKYANRLRDITDDPHEKILFYCSTLKEAANYIEALEQELDRRKI